MFINKYIIIIICFSLLHTVTIDNRDRKNLNKIIDGLVFFDKANRILIYNL